MSVIITIVCIMAFLGLGVLGVFKGKKAGVLKSGITLVFTIVAAVIALFCAVPLCKLCIRPILGLLSSAVSSLGLSEAFIAECGSAIIAMLIGPIVFVVLFLAIEFLLMIPLYFILKKALGDIGNPVVSKVFGAIVGCITCMLIVTLVLVPVAGYTRIFTLIPDMSQTAETSGTASLGSLLPVNSALNGMKEIGDNPILKIIYDCGGKQAFRVLTTSSINGTRVSVGEEVENIEPIVKKLTDGGISAENLEEIIGDESFLNEVTDAIGSSRFMSSVSAAALQNMFENFSKGESFLGIEPPKDDTAEGRLAMNALEKLKDCSSDEIADHFETIAKVATTVLTNPDGIKNGDMADILPDIINAAVEDELVGDLAVDYLLDKMTDLFNQYDIPPVSEEDGKAIQDEVSVMLSNAAKISNPDAKKKYCREELQKSFNAHGMEEIDDILDNLDPILDTYVKLDNPEKANPMILKLIAGLIEKTRK